jgi:hypothetical protein
MLGGTFIRTVYLFRVKTSLVQDLQLIAEFNALPNENHYNGFRRNCADFARSLVNQYFPGAAKPDHLNDFGMTSPKAIAKSFCGYAEKRPELAFTAERFDQLPGPIKRSSPCRKGTEVSFRLKKWFVPLLAMRSHELPFFLAAYALTGRFNPDAEVRRHPAEDAIPNFKWGGYKEAFREILFEDAEHLSAKAFFKELDQEGRVELDEFGRPVLELGGRKVGLSRSNILASGSDRELAYKIMLARIQAELSLPVNKREPIANFKLDWQLLQQLKETSATAVPAFEWSPWR